MSGKGVPEAHQILKECVDVIQAVELRQLAAPEILDGLNWRRVEPKGRDIPEKPRTHRMERNRTSVVLEQITDLLVADIFEERFFHVERLANPTYLVSKAAVTLSFERNTTA